MENQGDDRLDGALRAVRASVLQVLQAVDSLAAAVSLLQAEARTRFDGSAAPLAGSLIVDPASFTIRWNGRLCHLGCTLAYRLIERMAHKPDQYLSADRLLAEIWAGRRARSTVRTAVYDLRRRLIAAGMADLAGRIDGRVRGHYALVLHRR